MEIVLVTAERATVKQRVPNVTRSEIIRLAKQLQEEITDKTRLDTSTYLKPAQQLYEGLVRPLEPILKAQQINQLVFIVDAGLRSMPIAALHDGQQFIIEKYSVSMMPSFRLT